LILCGPGTSAHVVFLNGAEFVRYYNERIKFGGYLENYVTEGEAIEAVVGFMDHVRRTTP
jgi:hypothetical protein